MENSQRCSWNWRRLILLKSCVVLSGNLIAAVVLFNHKLATCYVAPVNYKAAQQEIPKKQVESFVLNMQTPSKTSTALEFPTFLTLQWPPPPTHKVFNLAMISQRVLQYGADEELVRLLQKGDVSSAVSSRNTVTLEQISDNLHSKRRRIILIEGAPGAGKSTLAWHLCNRWEAGELFSGVRNMSFLFSYVSQPFSSPSVLRTCFPLTQI